LCDAGWRLTAVRTVQVLAGAGTGGSQWATADGLLSPGRERELGPGGLARLRCDRSRPRPCLEATSATTDQVALEALGLLQLGGYPKMSRAETAPGFGQTWERCLSNSAGPEAGRFLLQSSHAGTRINVRFRRSRRSTPPDFSDGLWLISRRSARASSVEPSPTSWGRRSPKRPGLPLSPERHARPGAGGPRAGQLASA
jgi:hypothetical protein